MNPIVYVEIPVADMARARRFYERVFDAQLDIQDIDGNEMALFPHAEGQAGASVALARGASYAPGTAGPRVYFGVADVGETLRLAVSEGGQPHYPVTEVPGYGRVAEFIDTEGNCIALFAPSGPPSTAAA